MMRKKQVNLHLSKCILLETVWVFSANCHNAIGSAAQRPRCQFAPVNNVGVR